MAPPLPADFRTWKERDYLVARLVGDPRFLEAIEDRVNHPKHTVEEANMLASCLQPLDKSEIAAALAKSGMRPTPVKAAAATRAVTAAFGANGTDAALEILGKILTGELAVEERQAGIDGALAAILRQGSSKSDEIVLKLLLASPRPYSSDQEETTADPLPKKLLGTLRSNASADLRTRLAKLVVADSAAAALRKKVLPILLDPNPQNLEAQTIIYQSPTADAATLAALEKQFSALSAETLRATMGFPEQQTRVSADDDAPSAALPSQFSLTPDLLARVRGLLWCPTFTDLLDLQHHGLVKMADRPAALTLAASIPCASMRMNLRRTLNRHWSEGPQALRSNGPGGPTLVEPGFLTILKSLAKSNALVKTAPPPKPDASTPKRRAEQPAKKTATSPNDAAWLKLREDLTRDYCRRCRAAAVAQSVAERQTSGASPHELSIADAPLPPPANSEVDAVFQFRWPNELVSHPPQSADDALRLYYLRVGLRAKLNPTLTFYRRQMTSCLEHSLADGIWLEGLTETAAGEARTVR